MRPFGCAALLAVADEDGSELYMIEPSGVSYRYYACAYGKAKAAARTELEKLALNDKEKNAVMTVEQAVGELAKILVRVHDETKDKNYEIEMIWVKDGGLANLVPRDLVDRAHEEAKKEAEADSDMEEE